MNNHATHIFRFPLATLLAASLLSLAGQAGAESSPTLERIRSTKTINVGIRESSIPFSYIDGGKPVGYAVEICDKVVQSLKTKLKLDKLAVNYVPVTSANRIAMVTESNIDLECGSTTNNRERREKVAFSIPYYFAGAKMLTRSDAGVRDLVALTGKPVITTRGSTGEKILEDLNTLQGMNLKLSQGKDHAESFAAVASGKAAAFLMDDVILYSLRAKASNPGEYQVLDHAYSVEPLAIMLRKDDPAFKSAVDIEMANLMQNGEIRKLYGKWFDSSIPGVGKPLGIPMSRLLRLTIVNPSDQVGS